MPRPRARHASNGLESEQRVMSQVVTVSATTEGPAAEAVTEYREDGRCWRVAAGFGDLPRQAGVDWLHLETCPTARLMKRNSERDVWRVAAGGRLFFAKIYHPPRRWSARIKLRFRGITALREWTVGVYAARHGIAAVRPVAASWPAGGAAPGPAVLVTEAVPEAVPLDEHWLRIRHDRAAALDLVEAVARLIARAHQCGFRHNDMHPGNILVRPNGGKREIFFVDLQTVRVGRPVGFRAVVANLAQLNQWFRRHATRTQLRRFLRFYLAYRDRFAQAGPLAKNLAIPPSELIAELSREADRHAARLWAKRDRRAARDGRYFTRLRPASGWRGLALLCCKHPPPAATASLLTFTKADWAAWLRDPLRWVDPSRQQILKDSHTSTVALAELPAGPRPVKVIVKRPLARNPWKRLGQWLGRSRNMRSWRVAHMLLNRNLPVATPLAVVERYVAGLIRVDSISLTEYVPDAVDLEAFLTRDVAALDAATRRRVKDRLIEAVVGLVRDFHARGFVHRDFKAPNLLVAWRPPYEGRPSLTFIDMDGIRHVRRVRPAAEARALARLCASLLNCPACTATDRLRFLKRWMTAPGRTAKDWKLQWAAVARLVAAKLETKAHRRQWKLDHYGRE